MSMNRRRRRGSSLIEFTIAGIPTILLMITTIEMARGMWMYHTLAYAVKETSRFLVVKGSDCKESGNNCAITIGQMFNKFKESGLGLDPAKLTLTVTTSTNKTVCNADTPCAGNADPWPLDSGTVPGQWVRVEASIPFQSAILIIFPTSGTVSKLGEVTFSASSRELIQF
jgi:Flp pilus assembly protein TadG